MIDLSDIQGHQRVAALLLGLEADARAALIKRLPPDVLERVGQAMIDLDARLSVEGVVEQLKEELARTLFGSRVVRACDSSALSGILTGSLGREQGERLLQAILDRRKRGRPFVEVEAYHPFEIGRVLRGEAPPVAALVLSYLAPETTANVLKVFEQEQAVDILQRMVNVEPPSPDILASIASGVLEALETAPTVVGDADPALRIKKVADVLAQSPPKLERGVIEALAEKSAELARELREFMFTWEDVGGIDRRTMQKILGMVDTKTLSIALKGCSPQVEGNILGNLSSRVADIVAEERELAGPTPMNEVEQARADILKHIRAMIEVGEFRPSRGGEELVS